MIARRKGFTLLELIFSMGLSLIVLAAGYGAYFSFSRADDVERSREMVTIAAHGAMSRIKQDIRASSAATASGSTLSLRTSDGRVTYRSRSNGSGIDRIGPSSRSFLKGATASFVRRGGGVDVSVRASTKIHRRAVRIDLNSFVMPRNR
jgi:prepilin-type N-terminal cleavage/methylation domain-containing protein